MKDGARPLYHGCTTTFSQARALHFSGVNGMNMADTSGNSPNANLSLSDPNCIDESCQAFLDAENESQATISWAYQFERHLVSLW